MRHWIDRVTRMTLVDYALAIEVLAVAVWIEVRLRVMPFSRLVDRLSRPALMRGAFATETRLIQFVTVALDVLPVPNTCLRRSLVTYRLLQRRGLASRICFGVAKNGSMLDAHAWIVAGSSSPVDALPRFVELAPPAEELPHVINEQPWLLE